MKILTIHTDKFTWEPKKKALKTAEEIKDKKKHQCKDCLVVFTAVEKKDEENPPASVQAYLKNVKEIAEKVKTKTIVLYPYAHLSPDLASPKKAQEIMEKAEQGLKKEKTFKVLRSPFGWYKSFEISCKGHPLSELSRDITPGDSGKKISTKPGPSQAPATTMAKLTETEEAAMKAEEKIKKTLYVLDPEGKLTPAEKFDFSQHPSLKIFYEYEKGGSRKSQKPPAHIDYMKKLELLDYEPGSDPGNFRWYPKGVLIKRLLEKEVTKMVCDAGAMEVETPIMYDLEHPGLSKYLTRFPARQYRVLSDDKWFFLRFSACFGQYLIKHDMQISYKNLPLKMYELTKYSFRREQRGELAGIKRLRAFTMPDMHTLCADTKEAKEEFINQYKLSMKFMKDVELEYDVAIRFLEEFYKENEDFAKKLAKLVNKPILVELFDKRYAYFIMKFEFSINDSLNKAFTLSTVQIDVENTERFDITYVNKEGKKVHPLMLHASISGSIDRDICALLEKQSLGEKKGQKPILPLWLSPTQVRIIPLSVENHLDFSQKLADELEKNKIRVDIDDNIETVSKRIRQAEKEWVPYILVVGDKEIKSKELTARIRKTGQQKKITQDKLIKEINKKTTGLAFQKLSLPKLLSQRPKFN